MSNCEVQQNKFKVWETVQSNLLSETIQRALKILSVWNSIHSAVSEQKFAMNNDHRAHVLI